MLCRAQIPGIASRQASCAGRGPPLVTVMPTCPQCFAVARAARKPVASFPRLPQLAAAALARSPPVAQLEAAPMPTTGLVLWLPRSQLSPALPSRLGRNRATAAEPDRRRNRALLCGALGGGIRPPAVPLGAGGAARAENDAPHPSGIAGGGGCRGVAPRPGGGALPEPLLRPRPLHGRVAAQVQLPVRMGGR